MTLRRALVARHGLERGCEAAAEAIAWASEHREELAEMDNPLGYVYRVSRRCAAATASTGSASICSRTR